MRNRYTQRLRDFDPDRLRSLSRLGLYARNVVEGFVAGQHRSREMGWNVEFADYREYVRGDDPRTLDWKVYARTDRFYIRRFEEETSMRAYLALDTSASMGYAWEGNGKIDAAARLLASLAYLLVRQRDGVGLFTFSERLTTHLMPASTPAHLRRLWQSLETLETEGTTRVRHALHDLASRAKRRGLVVLVTDVLYDVEELAHGLALFTHRKFDLILFQVLTPAEIEFPFRGEHLYRDLEQRISVPAAARSVRMAYLEALGEHQARVRAECARLGIDYHLHRTDTPVEASLAAFLSRRLRLARG